MRSETEEKLENLLNEKLDLMSGDVTEDNQDGRKQLLAEVTQISNVLKDLEHEKNEALDKQERRDIDFDRNQMLNAIEEKKLQFSWPKALWEIAKMCIGSGLSFAGYMAVAKYITDAEKEGIVIGTKAGRSFQFPRLWNKND